GRQCALSLAAEGVNVAICGRTSETLDKTVGELRALGVHSLGVIGDVSVDEDIGLVHEAVVDGLGPIDILVNNAGGSRSREDITETSIEDFRGTFDLNVFGAFQLIKLALPHMQGRRWGRVINIASIWGREHGGNISYMSAKAALIASTKNAAVALAKDGVLVNSIAPGSIAHAGGSWERFQNDNPPDVVADFIKSNLPLGRFGWPEPVGDLVAFLSSDRAGLITGACIVVDGGQGYSMI
ncbi:MAG: SDR family oxidoreductase, partial [Chloroflexi bacterium]|nr:SDR family oxidoreductase [Chloroflexota bacterium]